MTTSDRQEAHSHPGPSAITKHSLNATWRAGWFAGTLRKPNLKKFRPFTFIVILSIVAFKLIILHMLFYFILLQSVAQKSGGNLIFFS